MAKLTLPKNAPPADSLEAYYDDDQGRFYFLSSRGHYLRCSRDHLKLELRRRGFNHKEVDGGMSECDEEILRIVNEQSVIYAGPLAGHDQGPQDYHGRTILVTSDRIVHEPEEMPWDDLEKFFTQLLGDQDVRLYAWIKCAWQAFRDQTFKPGPVLLLAGKAGGGKSLCQTLVGHVFGGRIVKPWRYFSGATSFNSELFQGELLAIGDDAGSSDIRTRRKMLAELKQVAAEQIHSCHKKSEEAIMMKPFWRCCVTANDDAEDMMVFPPMVESFRDKCLLLHCGTVTPPKGMAHNGYDKMLISQIPGLLKFLEEVDVPDELVDERFGVKGWQDPVLMDVMLEQTPEEKFWDIVLNVLLVKDVPEWAGTAAELEDILHQGSPQQARKNLSFSGAAGVFLARIAAKKDGRVERLGARSTWKVVSK